MGTIVEIESLPIIDPADEGRRIVWEGFEEAYEDFHHWHTSDTPPWPYSNAPEPPLLDMLVGPRYTFVSPEANEWLTFHDAQMAALRAELFATMEALGGEDHLAEIGLDIT